MESIHDHYRGSKIFSSVAKQAGLPLDQFNFLLSEILALIFAFCFRRYLPPKPNNVIKRHLVASLLGIALSQFCFGSQIWHLILQSCISYLMLCFISPKHSYKIVFAFCMLYLSAIHIHRVMYDFGNYTLDISGPLMINTQKLTALAFSFYDGYRSKQRAKRRRPDDDKDCPALTEDQDKQKTLEIPSPIEFLSYVFYFQGICVGPLCFYKDYIDYIEGRNLLVVPSNSESNTEDKVPVQSSVFWPVATKLAQCALWGYILTNFAPYYPVEDNISEKVVNLPMYKRLQYLLLSIFYNRSKYYFAFLLSEAVNNAGGLGLNGVDENGEAKWDLITNIKPFRIETATNTKALSDNWNIQTALWLRRVCYNRLGKGRTISVFVLSAIWHGFYVGYYICFGLAAIATYVGRGFRRQVRPYFQTNTITKRIYDVLTWFGTQVVFSFGIVSFCLPDITRIWYFYKSWYFCLPIALVLCGIIFNGESTKSAKKKQAQQQEEIIEKKSN